MSPKSKLHPVLLLMPLVVILILIVVLFALNPPGPDWPIRSTALLGYGAIVASVLSTAFVRPLTKAFGRPFVKIHHIYSIGGLAWITMHPLSVVVSWRMPEALLPNIDSFIEFVRWGGAPTLYLLIIAAGAAILRKRIGRGWRALHALNYLALGLGTLHALGLGGDFQSVLMRAVAVLVIVALVATAVWRRLLVAQRKRAR